MKITIAILIIGLFFPALVAAQEAQEELYINATAAILIERTTGRIIYERNANRLIYPASMIKVLTAIIALDHIRLDDIIIVGDEINYVPFGSSVVGHVEGEHISGHNLIRALLIPSGNDTSNVTAAHVSYLVTGSRLPFEEAEAVFIGLMNERARGLGATRSNFTNAHGFHDENMQTTVSDLAIIANYAMDNPTIRNVAAELAYTGYTVSAPEEGMQTREVTWNSTNRMLVGQFFHPDIIGLKTGFTTPAGRCFIGVAQRDGIELISVIAGSEDPYRWHSTADLVNHGFDNYFMHTIQQGGSIIDDINIYNPRWGDADLARAYVQDTFIHFLNHSEVDSLERRIVYNEDLTVLDEYGEIMAFVAPLYAGTIIGSVIHTINGTEIFRDDIIITEDILAWSFGYSFLFVITFLRENPLSIFGLSFLLGLIFLGIIIFKITSFVVKILNRRKRGTSFHRPRYKYK